MDNDLILKAVRILIGPVSPAADSAIDGGRIENLKSMCALTDSLLSEIRSVARSSDSQFASVNKMAQVAKSFLKNIETE